eukprot:gene2711-1575_t
MGGDGKKNRELVRERRNGMPTRRPANAKAARNLDGPNHPCIEQRGFCHNPKGCPFTNLKPSVCWMLLKHGSCNGRMNGEAAAGAPAA